MRPLTLALCPCSPMCELMARHPPDSCAALLSTLVSRRRGRGICAAPTGTLRCLRCAAVMLASAALRTLQLEAPLLAPAGRRQLVTAAFRLLAAPLELVSAKQHGGATGARTPS